MGSQPRGLQHNHEGKSCEICYMNEVDVPHHVLFRCTNRSLSRIRLIFWKNLIDMMPEAMKSNVLPMSDFRRCTFILSGLGGNFVPEWMHLYSQIALLVSKMYIERAKIYIDPG